MERDAGYSVSQEVASPRGIAAVRARLPISRVSASFTSYLNQVYAAARDGVVHLDGQNIFVYRNTDTPDVVDAEFGVGVVDAPFSPSGQVTYAELPTGDVATTTHWGDYSRLGNAHAAVIAWCKANGRSLVGTRWEIYGHWSDDPARVRTDVFYLLKPSA